MGQNGAWVLLAASEASVKPAYEEVASRWRYLFINKWFYMDIASYTLTLVIIGQSLAIFSASSMVSALIIK